MPWALEKCRGRRARPGAGEHTHGARSDSPRPSPRQSLDVSGPTALVLRIGGRPGTVPEKHPATLGTRADCEATVWRLRGAGGPGASAGPGGSGLRWSRRKQPPAAPSPSGAGLEPPGIVLKHSKETPDPAGFSRVGGRGLWPTLSGEDTSPPPSAATVPEKRTTPSLDTDTQAEFQGSGLALSPFCFSGPQLPGPEANSAGEAWADLPRPALSHNLHSVIRGGGHYRTNPLCGSCPLPMAEPSGSGARCSGHCRLLPLSPERQWEVSTPHPVGRQNESEIHLRPGPGPALGQVAQGFASKVTTPQGKRLNFSPYTKVEDGGVR